MVNTSEVKYNLTGAETYGELFQHTNKFVGGTIGIGLTLTVWLVVFFSLQGYPNTDALKASTWVAWLTSLFMTLVGVVQPAFSILLFLAVLTVTGLSSKQGR